MIWNPKPGETVALRPSGQLAWMLAHIDSRSSGGNKEWMRVRINDEVVASFEEVDDSGVWHEITAEEWIDGMPCAVKRVATYLAAEVRELTPGAFELQEPTKTEHPDRGNAAPSPDLSSESISAVLTSAVLTSAVHELRNIALPLQSLRIPIVPVTSSMSRRIAEDSAMRLFALADKLRAAITEHRCGAVWHPGTLQDYGPRRSGRCRLAAGHEGEHDFPETKE